MYICMYICMYVIHYHDTYKAKGPDEAHEAAVLAVVASLASEDAPIPSRGRERLG